ncbi:MAG TPA: glycosyltransferase, partial [Stellaceae bacterium]|nr:glycosyltransferase [Stellaceae bacterium]
RGYPQFMRMAAEVAAQRPDAIFVSVGGDGPGYGRPRADGASWRTVLSAESGLGDRMVHIPWLPHQALVNLFQVSAAHVYLSVPFVLSWSLLEAMACACLIVGSATPPVQEVVTDGVNGLLAPFFDENAIARRVLDALQAPGAHAVLRSAARATVVDGYELEACLDRQMAMIQGLLPEHGHIGADQTALL